MHQGETLEKVRKLSYSFNQLNIVKSRKEKINRHRYQIMIPLSIFRQYHYSSDMEYSLLLIKSMTSSLFLGIQRIDTLQI